MRGIPELSEDEWILLCDILSGWIGRMVVFEDTGLPLADHEEVKKLYEKISHTVDKQQVRPLEAQVDWVDLTPRQKAFISRIIKSKLGCSLQHAVEHARHCNACIYQLVNIVEGDQ